MIRRAIRKIISGGLGLLYQKSKGGSLLLSNPKVCVGILAFCAALISFTFGIFFLSSIITLLNVLFVLSFIPI